MRVEKVRVCFEGIDGCGKSVQASLLAEALRKENVEPRIVKHPGGTEFGQALRELVLYGSKPSSTLARGLLFWADAAESTARYQHEQIVIFERHPIYSNLAWGIVELDFDEDAHFGLVDALWEHILRPDITFVLDVPARVALERQRGQNKKAMTAEAEREYEERLERVRMAYLKLGRVFPEVVIVGGMQDPLELHREVLRMLGRKYSVELAQS